MPKGRHPGLLTHLHRPRPPRATARRVCKGLVPVLLPSLCTSSSRSRSRSPSLPLAPAHTALAQLADFGLSELRSADGQVVGDLGGTVTHVAPESVLHRQVRAGRAGGRASGRLAPYAE